MSPAERRGGAVSESLLVSARLTGDQSLAVFRAALEAASRPGKVVDLPAGAATGVPPVVVPVLALADLDVSVSTLEDDGAARWEASIRSATGCRLAPADEADMVVALRPATAGDVRTLRTGTAHAPERGARFFVSCASLTEGRSNHGVALRVQGPGASKGRTMTVSGLAADVFAALATVNRSFPAGVDTWLVTADARMVGIPRSSRIEIVEGESS